MIGLVSLPAIPSVRCVDYFLVVGTCFTTARAVRIAEVRRTNTFAILVDIARPVAAVTYYRILDARLSDSTVSTLAGRICLWDGPDELLATVM